MAVIQNLAVTQGSAVQINVLDTTVSCQVVDDTVFPQVLISDFTGPNVIHFPSDLAGMTVDQRTQVLNAIVKLLISFKSGVPLA